MMATVDMKKVAKVAEVYEVDVEQVLELMEEGFTLEEAEEIIEAGEM